MGSDCRLLEQPQSSFHCITTCKPRTTAETWRRDYMEMILSLKDSKSADFATSGRAETSVAISMSAFLVTGRCLQPILTVIGSRTCNTPIFQSLARKPHSALAPSDCLSVSASLVCRCGGGDQRPAGGGGEGCLLPAHVHGARGNTRTNTEGNM